MRITLPIFLLLAVPKLIAQQPKIGITTGIENANIAAAHHYLGINESCQKWLSPMRVSDSAFKNNLLLLNKIACPIATFNLFIPAQYKVVGPAVDEEKILNYVEKVFERQAQTTAKIMVWGSGGSRSLPEGFSQETANKQIIKIGKKIAQLAKKYGITVAMENLNKTECNNLNSVASVLQIVKAIDHPNLGINIDIYHMLMDGDGPEMILKCKKWIKHVEIAEPNGRTAPGVQKTDFIPYFKALKKVKYNGLIVIEGVWSKLDDIASLSIDYLTTEWQKAK